MIRAVLVDDEKTARDVLRGLIENHFSQIEIVGEAASVTEALKLINREKPALLFLDVELGKETSFDLLHKIDVGEADIIFTTAHEHYALQAIKFAALDYLLKPISKDDLQQALERMERRTIKIKLNDLLNLFRYNLDSKSPRLKKILLPVHDHLESISLSDIIRCEGDDNYTTFHLADKRKIMVSYTLKKYEEMFEDCGFCRVYQSHLINMAHVEGYVKGDGGFVIMADKSQVEVSRRKKEEFLRRLAEE